MKGSNTYSSDHVVSILKNPLGRSTSKSFSFLLVLFKQIYMIMAIFLQVEKRNGTFVMETGLGAKTGKEGIAFSILLNSKEDIN